MDLADFRKIVKYVKSADKPNESAPTAAAATPMIATAAAVDPADRAAAAEAAAQPPPELSSMGGDDPSKGVRFASRKISGLGRSNASKDKVMV